MGTKKDSSIGFGLSFFVIPSFLLQLATMVSCCVLRHLKLTLPSITTKTVNTMKLFEFSLLPQYQQLDLLYQEGVFIGKLREEPGYKVLYQFNSFYVEIIYKKYRRVVSRIRCFESTNRLDAYLHQMDIEELISCC